MRDAEKAQPGVVKQAIDAEVKAGRSPTRAAIKRATKPKVAARKASAATNFDARIAELDARIAECDDENNLPEDAPIERRLVAAFKRAQKAEKALNENETLLAELLNNARNHFQTGAEFDAWCAANFPDLSNERRNRLIATNRAKIHAATGTDGRGEDLGDVHPRDYVIARDEAYAQKSEGVAARATDDHMAHANAYRSERVAMYARRSRAIPVLARRAKSANHERRTHHDA
jgi:hypothetical protein